MISFDIRRGYIKDLYKDVSLTCNGTTIELGLLDKGELLELAERLRDAAYDIDDGEGKEYLNPGLEKAYDIAHEFMRDLMVDHKVNEAQWVGVALDYIKDEIKV